MTISKRRQSHQVPNISFNIPNIIPEFPTIDVPKVDPQLINAFRSVHDISEKIASAARIGQGILSPLSNAIDTLTPALEQGLKIQQAIADIIQPITVAMRPVIPVIHYFHENLSAVTKSVDLFIKGWNRLHQGERERIELYAEFGWYITPYRSISDLSENIDENNIDEIMAGHVDNEIPMIERDLCLHHPSRAKFFEEMFNSYRNGQFMSATLLAYSQADGIAFDTFSIPATARRKGQRLKDKIKTDDNQPSLLDIWFSELKHDDPIITRDTEHLPPDTINRHCVAHGLSTKYPEKADCLKAISFLSCLDWYIDTYHNDEIEEECKNEQNS